MKKYVQGFLLFLALFAANATLAQTKGYVLHLGDGTVSVIDTATNTVTATFPAGFGSLGMAVAPDGARVYTTNVFTNTISSPSRRMGHGSTCRILVPARSG